MSASTNKNWQRKIAKREELKRSQLAADLGTVLETDAGRRVMRDLIFDACNVEACTFTGNSSGYFEEGKRWVGTRLLRAIKTSQPSLYLRMVQEEVNDEQLEAQLQEAADAAEDDE